MSLYVIFICYQHSKTRCIGKVQCGTPITNKNNGSNFSMGFYPIKILTSYSCSLEHFKKDYEARFFFERKLKKLLNLKVSTFFHDLDFFFAFLDVSDKLKISIKNLIHQILKIMTVLSKFRVNFQLLFPLMGKRSKQARHLAALRASKKAKQERQTDQDISGEPADDTAPEPDYQLLSENVPEVVRTLKECIPPAFLSRIDGYSGKSRMTLWRRKREQEHLVKVCPMRKIQSYFTVESKVEEENSPVGKDPVAEENKEKEKIVD